MIPDFKWGPFEVSTVYGRSAADGTRYLKRYIVYTPWGTARFHVFFRGDVDPAPHDHPWPFWTFPLRGYWEDVLPAKGDESLVRAQYVAPFKLHYRPACHTHKVLARADGKPIYTFVVTGRMCRKWGFETGNGWVYWRDYIFKHGGSQ